MPPAHRARKRRHGDCSPRVMIRPRFSAFLPCGQPAGREEKDGGMDQHAWPAPATMILPLTSFRRQLREVFVHGSSIVLAMEAMECSLYDVVRCSKVSFGEAKAKGCVKALLAALAHVHGMGLIHRSPPLPPQLHIFSLRFTTRLSLNSLHPLPPHPRFHHPLSPCPPQRRQARQPPHLPRRRLQAWRLWARPHPSHERASLLIPGSHPLVPMPRDAMECKAIRCAHHPTHLPRPPFLTFAFP